ncbi:MAG: hypothetical protein VX941_00600 [Pseudomonadota bacterium]|nr:hypothetical protein [Pseudomonadota bacterium]
MDIYDPSGATEITELHSPRFNSLDGKKIALLSNDSWQAHRTLPLVGEMLKAEYPSIEIIPYEEFPIGNAVIDSDATVIRAKELAVDGVLIGNAA